MLYLGTIEGGNTMIIKKIANNIRKRLNKDLQCALIGTVDYESIRNVLCTLNGCTDENQRVILYINSGGGDVHAGMEIIRALRRCPGKVTAKVKKAHSMAAMIMMQCDTIECDKDSSIMFHYWRYAADKPVAATPDSIDGSRQAEMTSYFMREFKHFTKNGILTTDEFFRLHCGEDIWLKGKEFIRRLQNAKESTS